MAVVVLVVVWSWSLAWTLVAGLVEAIERLERTTPSLGHRGVVDGRLRRCCLARIGQRVCGVMVFGGRDMVQMVVMAMVVVECTCVCVCGEMQRGQVRPVIRLEHETEVDEQHEHEWRVVAKPSFKTKFQNKLMGSIEMRIKEGGAGSLLTCDGADWWMYVRTISLATASRTT